MKSGILPTELHTAQSKSPCKSAVISRTFKGMSICIALLFAVSMVSCHAGMVGNTSQNKIRCLKFHPCPRHIKTGLVKALRTEKKSRYKGANTIHSPGLCRVISTIDRCVCWDKLRMNGPLFRPSVAISITEGCPGKAISPLISEPHYQATKVGWCAVRPILFCVVSYDPRHILAL
jgi:hypothetical protein